MFLFLSEAASSCVAQMWAGRKLKHRDGCFFFLLQEHCCPDWAWITPKKIRNGRGHLTCRDEWKRYLLKCFISASSGMLIKHTAKLHSTCSWHGSGAFYPPTSHCICTKCQSRQRISSGRTGFNRIDQHCVANSVQFAPAICCSFVERPLGRFTTYWSWAPSS